jgi:hypothetical protein
MVISTATTLCEDLAEEVGEPLVEHNVVPSLGRGAKRRTRIQKEKEIKVAVRRSSRLKNN